VDSLPVVTITEPEFNHSYASDERSAQIRGEAYDREGIRKVEIRIDGGSWMELSGMTGQGTIGWAYYLDVSSLSPGSHSFEVRAHDTLGETSPGHITQPQGLLIFKEAPPEDDGNGSLVPGWLISGIVLAFIACAFVFGSFCCGASPDRGYPLRFTKPNPTDPVIEVLDAKKTFGRTVALDGVDLKVRRGTLHGIIGPNGAGKSTLIGA